MPTVWFSLRKSLHCRSDPSQVHDPKTKNQLATILTRKPGRSGCSRSIETIKDAIIIGGACSKGVHLEKPVSCSPRSIGSSDFVNPIAHEVVVSDSKCELKITGFSGGGGGGGDRWVGSLVPGTPGPDPVHGVKNKFTGNNGVPLKVVRGGGVAVMVTCHKCGKQFGKWEYLEDHHLSKNAVTELIEDDSSRKIVEIICRVGWFKPDNNTGRVEKVFKVHSMQKTLARFEEYRESVKTKASKLPKKHPRCLADGNELLRFYGTTIACSLGMNDESSLCVSDKCCACRIIRHGFSTNREFKGGIGVFTTSTSARAFESIEVSDNGPDTRKALMVCRVIAGRVHRPLENIQEITRQMGFDSLAGKIGLHSNIEDLYLLSPKALLPYEAQKRHGAAVSRPGDCKGTETRRVCLGNVPGD